MAEPKNWREYVERLMPPWLSRNVGQRFVGAHAILADLITHAAYEALQAPWLATSTSPNDALPFVGTERRLPRYPAETPAQYRTRLLDAWEAYDLGGWDGTIVAQLANAGWPGARVYYPGIADFDPSGYWSHFFVFFPVGTHTVTGSAQWGSFNWGDGTNYGPIGITPEQLATIRGIIQKWKPVDWICRKIVFEISGWSYGTGHTWGEGGLVWGGQSVEVGA